MTRTKPLDAEIIAVALALAFTDRSQSRGWTPARTPFTFEEINRQGCAMHSHPIAFIDCADGRRRPVREDFAGRQYVLDDDGEPVYDIWFIPRENCDRPVIVDTHPHGPEPF